MDRGDEERARSTHLRAWWRRSRGFPIDEAADFGAVVGLFPSFEGDSLGGVAPRARIAGQVMESTRLDKRVKLRLHSEMAYMQDYPARIAFFCRKRQTLAEKPLLPMCAGFCRRFPIRCAARSKCRGS